MSPDHIERSTAPVDARVASMMPGHGQLFISPDAAAQWAADHPKGEIRPVEEAFAVDRQVVTQVGWTAP